MNKTLYSWVTQDACIPLPWKQLEHKRILITGGTGFIGRALAMTLCEVNTRFTLDMTLGLLHRKTTKLPFFDPCVHWIEGDIVENFIPKDFMPDIIIHAASPANQQAIMADPAGVVDCNIVATRYLLENARKSNALVLFFSSGEVYQRHPGKIAEESAEMIANKSKLPLYGSSKLAGELLCEQYHQKYGVDCRILRLFSIFGPGELLTSGRCFTDFLRQALKNQVIQVTGSGTQIRSHCYVSDFVSGLLYVLLKGESTVYNIGNEENTCTIFELAEQIAALHGNTTVIGPLSTVDAADVVDSFVPDTTKLRQVGWKPQVDLQTCIRRCLDSYRLEGEKI